MQGLNNIVVYHGSYTDVETPDLNICKSGKDSCASEQMRRWQN